MLRTISTINMIMWISCDDVEGCGRVFGVWWGFLVFPSRFPREFHVFSYNWYEPPNLKLFIRNVSVAKISIKPLINNELINVMMVFIYASMYLITINTMASIPYAYRECLLVHVKILMP